MALTQRDWVNDEAPAIDAIYLNELDDEVRRLDTDKVGNSGNETINGIKTFTSAPIFPASNVETGSVVIYKDASSRTFTDTAFLDLTVYTKFVSVLNPYNGTLNVSFKMNGLGDMAYAKIYVNDVAVGFERSTSGIATFTEDIVVSQGDEISIYGKTGDNNSLTISDLQLFASEATNFIKTY